jgi:hypothetical protein
MGEYAEIASYRGWTTCRSEGGTRPHKQCWEKVAEGIRSKLFGLPLERVLVVQKWSKGTFHRELMSLYQTRKP